MLRPQEKSKSVKDVMYPIGHKLTKLVSKVTIFRLYKYSVLSLQIKFPQIEIQINPKINASVKLKSDKLDLG